MKSEPISLLKFQLLLDKSHIAKTEVKQGSLRLYLVDGLSKMIVTMSAAYTDKIECTIEEAPYGLYFLDRTGTREMAGMGDVFEHELHETLATWGRLETTQDINGWIERINNGDYFLSGSGVNKVALRAK